MEQHDHSQYCGDELVHKAIDLIHESEGLETNAEKPVNHFDNLEIKINKGYTSTEPLQNTLTKFYRQGLIPKTIFDDGIFYLTPVKNTELQTQNP